MQWLSHWQELIGAIIGGLMGFVGAFWVAHSVKRREEVIAAKIIISYLMSIQEKTKTLDGEIEAIPEERQELEFALRYLQRRPIPSPLIDMAIANISALSNKLPALLQGFRIISLNIEDASFRLLERRINAEINNLDLQRTIIVNSDVQDIYQGAHYASSLADKIIPLLNKLVISKLRFLYNILSFFPEEHDCACYCNQDE